MLSQNKTSQWARHFYLYSSYNCTWIYTTCKLFRSWATSEVFTGHTLPAELSRQSICFVPVQPGFNSLCQCMGWLWSPSDPVVSDTCLGFLHQYRPYISIEHAGYSQCTTAKSVYYVGHFVSTMCTHAYQNAFRKAKNNKNIEQPRCSLLLFTCES